MQECLERRGRSYRFLTQDTLQRMAAEDPSPYIVKAGCGSPLVGSRSTNGTIKFIRSVLLIMLDSPKLAELVATIQRLPEPTQQVVGTLMQEMVDWDPEANIDIDEEHRNGAAFDLNPERKISPNPDPRAEVLRLEEQYAKIISQLERRNVEYADLETELHAVSDSLARSQETNVSLNHPLH